jgi:DUF1009 family protein
MVGGIAKPRLFREIMPDARALAAIARIGKLRDDLLCERSPTSSSAKGIRVVPSTTYLDEIVPAAGVLGARTPSAEEWADIRYGFQVVKVIGQLRHRPERRGARRHGDGGRGDRGHRTRRSAARASS